MTEWREVALGDVAKVSWGDTSTTKASYVNKGFVAYSASGPDGLLPHADRGGDGVVISAIGAQCGKTWFAQGQWSCIKNTMWFQAGPNADSRFLYYATADPGQWPKRGAAQPFIGLGDAKQLRLRVPQLDLQRRIAAVLGAFDDLIENNRRRVAVLEEMARAIYREWFVHFRYPGHESVPLVDSPLGPIPDGWGTPALAELVTTQYGYTESATTDPVGPRYLRGMDINKTSYIDWHSVPYCQITRKNREKFSVQIGDVFVIRMADPGKVGMCEVEVDAVFASYLVRLRPASETLDPYFLFFTLCDDAYQGWVTGASTGATRKSVSAKVMTEPRITLPVSGLQERFREVAMPLRGQLNQLLRHIDALRTIRDLLLPKLVTGQIDVSSLDLDSVVEGSVG